jgi:hypothetical protein
MLNTRTADIVGGNFVQVFMNDDPDDTRKKFITDDGREIFFGVEQKHFLKRIDFIHKHLEYYKNEFYNFTDECEQGCSDDFSESDWYLIFTSLEKAKEVNKTIIIPDLMKDSITATNNYMEKYMKAVDEFQALEIKLKNLTK